MRETAFRIYLTTVVNRDPEGMAQKPQKSMIRLKNIHRPLTLKHRQVFEHSLTPVMLSGPQHKSQEISWTISSDHCEIKL